MMKTHAFLFTFLGSTRFGGNWGVLLKTKVYWTNGNDQKIAFHSIFGVEPLVLKKMFHFWSLPSVQYTLVVPIPVFY